MDSDRVFQVKNNDTTHWTNEDWSTIKVRGSNPLDQGEGVLGRRLKGFLQLLVIGGWDVKEGPLRSGRWRNTCGAELMGQKVECGSCIQSPG